jgi:uncharacterized protein (DUF433 family)
MVSLRGQEQPSPSSLLMQPKPLLEESLSHHRSPDGGNGFDLMNPGYRFLSSRLASSSEPVRDSVSMDPRVMHGNPVFTGTRIPVYVIIEELAESSALQELSESYPSLTAETIRCGLDFAASLLRIYVD